MRVLVVGSGGREHALVWKIRQSRLAKEIFCAPGNAGIAELAQCVDLEPADIPGLLKFARDHRIDFTVVGPEAPLVLGIVDEFQKEGLKIFGPSKQAARLEGSKVFAKQFMKRHKIPTGAFEVADSPLRARPFCRVLREMASPAVIKADGLAGGKGVLIGFTMEETEEILQQVFEKKIFKEAGRQVVIEEYLRGKEASILAISDGSRFILLEASQDHKRALEHDCGPNTGGMGAYSPTPFVSPELMKEIARRIVGPTIRGMREEGCPFKGVLYIGLMITKEGPFVLEYNVRFGDPEAQAVLPRLKSDLLRVMLRSARGLLWWPYLRWDLRWCVCVVMGSQGYPEAYETGKEIKGLDLVTEKKDALVFHAGTRKSDGRILSSGGRVLGVTALGEEIKETIKNTYEAVDKIHFENRFFRRDIGSKAIEELARLEKLKSSQLLLRENLFTPYHGHGKPRL